MWCLLPIACLGLALLGHAITTRVWPAGNRVTQFLGLGLACGIPVVFPPEFLPMAPVARLAGIAAYAFACELYIFLFTFVTSSVSVSLLVGEAEEATAGVSLDPDEMVRRRLQAMTEAGLLSRDQDRYHLTAKGHRIVAAFRVLRRFFHDAPSS